MSNVKFSRNFLKARKKSPQKIQKAFNKRLALFLNNPKSKTLRLHKLEGKYKGLQSINVTGDWRAIFSKKKSEKKIIYYFQFLGTHSQLYK